MLFPTSRDQKQFYRQAFQKITENSEYFASWSAASSRVKT